jgi:hypothetical protein
MDSYDVLPIPTISTICICCSICVNWGKNSSCSERTGSFKFIINSSFKHLMQKVKYLDYDAEIIEELLDVNSLVVRKNHLEAHRLSISTTCICCSICVNWGKNSSCSERTGSFKFIRNAYLSLSLSQLAILMECCRRWIKKLCWNNRFIISVIYSNACLLCTSLM